MQKVARKGVFFLETGAVISQFGSQGMSLAFCHAVQYFPETGTMIHLAGMGQFV